MLNVDTHSRFPRQWLLGSQFYHLRLPMRNLNYPSNILLPLCWHSILCRQRIWGGYFRSAAQSELQVHFALFSPGTNLHVPLTQLSLLTLLVYADAGDPQGPMHPVLFVKRRSDHWWLLAIGWQRGNDDQIVGVYGPCRTTIDWSTARPDRVNDGWWTIDQSIKRSCTQGNKSNTGTCDRVI